jgi:hypothetical protein
MTAQAGELLLNEVAPRILALTPSLNPVGAEDRDELAQDAIALAAALLASTQARGKKVSAGNVSYYAVKLVRQGRRSTGASQTDVMHPGTQMTGRSRLVSMDASLTDVPPGEEALCLHDLLAAQTEDPAMAASRRLDWKRLSAFLDPGACEVLACLSQGEDLTSLVPKLRRSRSALQGDKNRLARLVREHLGADTLSQVQAGPRWMDNLATNREKKECRQRPSKEAPSSTQTQTTLL